MSAEAVPSPSRPFAGAGLRHGLAAALAHEVPAAALMLAACAAGEAAALCGAAVVLALLSCLYARAARRSPAAREHIVDLWAMLLVMVGIAFAEGGGAAGAVGGGAAGSVGGIAAGSGGGFAAPALGDVVSTGRGGAAPAAHAHLAAAGPLAAALIAVAIAGWIVARVLLARRVVRGHTIVSAVVCGGMLAAMLVM